MPTRNINLTDKQDAFVDEIVDSGEFQNASEAIRAGLRLLKQQRAEDALKLRRLRALVKQGVDDRERGDYVEVDAAGLEKLLGIARPVRRRSR
jgi:antitoxin ParD1/3/4